MLRLSLFDPANAGSAAADQVVQNPSNLVTEINVNFLTVSGLLVPAITQTAFNSTFWSTADTLAGVIDDVRRYVWGDYYDGESDPYEPSWSRDAQLAGFWFVPDSSSKRIICANFAAQIFRQAAKDVSRYDLFMVMTEDFFAAA